MKNNVFIYCFYANKPDKFGIKFWLFAKVSFKYVLQYFALPSCIRKKNSKTGSC